MAQATEKTAVWSAAYGQAVAVSDTTPVGPTRAVFVGGAGSLVVRMLDGTIQTFVCPAGITIPIQVDRVMAATTATAIVALW